MKLSFSRRWSCLAISAVVASLSSGAGAQTPSSDTGDKVGSSTNRGGAFSAQGKQAKQSKDGQHASKRQLMANRLIGMSVLGVKGNNVGHIEDLAIDMKTGQVHFAVLEFDPGFLAGERLVAIPVRDLRMGPDRNTLLYENARKDKLQTLSVADDEWSPAFLKNRDKLAKLEEGWGLPRTDVKNTLLVRATDVLDKEVQNRSGENVGEIEDLALDMDQQKVHYAVMELERGWLSPERIIILPLTAFSNPAGSGDELVLDVTKDKVKSMQGLSRDQIRNADDPRVLSIVERHFAFFDAKNPLSEAKK